ncbi:MAG: flagellar type III secretion system pore protein FliP [Bdellovibrionales bacterium]|nr:flagellar type III secretion system pore protein FliP [Bdellovibrionales bacterium]
MYKRVVPYFIIVLCVLWAGDVLAQSAIPDLNVSIGGEPIVNSQDGVSSALKIVILLSVFSFVPALILTTTCFTRIVVVLGMTRTALGTNQAPPNMVLTGLALFLTASIMQPVFHQVYERGIAPYIDGQMTPEEAWKEGSEPLRQFLVKHSREKDLALFLEISKSEIPESPEDVPFLVAVPSFVLSELNMAFQIGFLLALPFLVLDMVVSSVLTSMSMITLPPVVISLPLKLMLFVVVDGWHLLISSLVQTYQVT